MRMVPLLTLVELAVVLALLALLLLAIANLSDRIKGALTPKGLPKAGLGATAPKPKPTPLDDLVAAAAIIKQGVSADKFDAQKCADLKALRGRLAANGNHADIVDKLDELLERLCES